MMVIIILDILEFLPFKFRFECLIYAAQSWKFLYLQTIGDLVTN